MNLAAPLTMPSTASESKRRELGAQLLAGADQGRFVELVHDVDLALSTGTGREALDEGLGPGPGRVLAVQEPGAGPPRCAQTTVATSMRMYSMARRGLVGLGGMDLEQQGGDPGGEVAAADPVQAVGDVQETVDQGQHGHY